MATETQSGRLNWKAKLLAKEKQRLDSILEKSWMLGENTIESIVPGDEKRLAELLDAPFDNPFLKKNQFDIENPATHLLSLMRVPSFFPFTCEKVFNINVLPMQNCILNELWYKPFPMLVGSRGMGKSFILALYMMLKALIHQGTKIVIVGAAFRQAKVVFEYVEMIWANAPVLKDLCGGGKGRNNREQGPRRDIDRCECIIGDSIIMALPLGDGKKIRGQRANIIIADEFASIPPDIYETVVAGFAAVSQDPVGNVKEEAQTRVLKKLGLWDAGMEAKNQNTGRENQAILSGTAYYAFNWFARYWNRYKQIIESRGDPNKLAALSPDGILDETLNYRDYVIIRIPVGMLPPGFMAAKHVARSKMTVHSGIFLMEFGAVFASDSDGFFKLSLIESCVAGGANNETGYCFTAALKGDHGITHVMGIDPAAESDNFAIIILAIYGDHRRVVYSWTTRKKDFHARQKVGLTKEQTFYGFAARKIRELMKVFPCERIGMDAQGGGGGVLEALHDAAYIHPGEVPIWEVKDPDPKKKKDSDAKAGMHLVEMVQFARAEWTSEANHGMKKDLEDKALLFPYMDAPLLGLSIEDDAKQKRIYDTLEDATMEVEQLKVEMATIVVMQTPTGRERWDVPTVKGQGQSSGRLRKDRYSALLIANMLARQMARGPRPTAYASHGGWASDLVAGNRERSDEPTYIMGEKWGVMPENVPLGKAIRRSGR